MSQPRQLRLHVSPALPFAFEPLGRGEAIADLVHAFYVVRTEPEKIADTMPAYSAQLLVFIAGQGALHPEEGGSHPLGGVCATTPQLKACDFTLEGPVTIVGASLTPLGWAALTSIPVDELNNRTLPGSRILPQEEVTQLEALARLCRDGKGQPDQLCDAITQMLSARRDALNSSHVRFVEDVMSWLSSDLNPSVQTLYDNIAMSERTAQRMCRRYFGVAPSHLIKRFRAIRAAMLLANPDLSSDKREEIQDAYFDQAHLIRDIRRYTGRTPGELHTHSLSSTTLDPDAHGQTAQVLR